MRVVSPLLTGGLMTCIGVSAGAGAAGWEVGVSVAEGAGAAVVWAAVSGELEGTAAAVSEASVLAEAAGLEAVGEGVELAGAHTVSFDGGVSL